jgi:hypothetical protein
MRGGVVGGVMGVDVDEQMRWMWMKMRSMLTASFKLREGDEGLHWAAGDGEWVTRTATVGGGGGGGSALVAFSQ